MKTIYIVSAIVLIVIVGVAGAYAAGIFNQPTKIRVGVLQGDIHQLAFHVAVNESYFVQNGLDIQKYVYARGPDLMQAFLAGDLDFAYVGVVPAMIYRGNALSVGNLTNLPVAIASVNLEGSAIVVNPTVIQSIADLNGKKVGTPGTGTIQETLLSMFAVEQNITIIKFPSSNANLPLDFSKGEAGGGVDALIAWEPTPSRVVILQNASVLSTSEDIFEDHQCCILIVTQKFMTEHPDIVTKMANIHRTATAFINSNPAEVKQIAANFTGQTMPVIEMAFNDVLYSTTLNTNSIRVFLLDLINQGIITTINASQVDTFLQDFLKPQ